MRTVRLLTDRDSVMALPSWKPLHETSFMEPPSWHPIFYGTQPPFMAPTFMERPAKDGTPTKDCTPKDSTSSKDGTPILRTAPFVDRQTPPCGQTNTSENITFPQLRNTQPIPNSALICQSFYSNTHAITG